MWNFYIIKGESTCTCTVKLTGSKIALIIKLENSLKLNLIWNCSAAYRVTYNSNLTGDKIQKKLKIWILYVLLKISINAETQKTIIRI